MKVVTLALAGSSKYILHYRKTCHRGSWEEKEGRAENSVWYSYVIDMEIRCIWPEWRGKLRIDIVANGEVKMR